MQRVTFSIDDDMAADFDDIVKAQGYQSRSEAGPRPYPARGR